MNSPKISIIIPVYNAGKYLRDCLDSISSQSYSKWECILIDDGSTDSSTSICDEYALKDNRFKVKRKENGGVSSTRNYGLDYASGDYITFIDADDIACPDYLLKMITKSEYDLVSCNHQEFGASEREIGWEAEKLFRVKDLDGSFMDREAHPGNSRYLFCWGHLFKKSIIDKYNLRFDTQITVGEDTNFVIEYISNSKNIYQIPYIGIRYRTFRVNFYDKYPLNYSAFLKHAESVYEVGQKFELATNTKEFGFIRHNVNVYFLCYLSYLKRQKNYISFCNNLHPYSNIEDCKHIYQLLNSRRKTILNWVSRFGYFGFCAYRFLIRI